MIFLSIGLPCRFSERCEALLAQLIAAASAQPRLVLAENLQQVGRALLQGNHDNVLIISRQPSRDLAEAFFQRPVMLTLDHPHTAAASLIDDHGLSRVEAIRNVANAMVTLQPLLNAECALVLRPENPVLPRVVAAHFDLEAQATVPDITQEKLMLAPAEHSEPASPVAKAVYDTIGFIPAEKMLDPIWSWLNGEPLSEIIWGPSLFFLGHAPGAPADSPIDITGAARCLVFGPYLRLPAGSWSCGLLLGCAANGTRLIAEIYAGALLNRATIQLHETGVFEIELSFVHSDPDQPVEVRLFTAEAAFEGEIVLGQVRMQPLKARRLA